MKPANQKSTCYSHSFTEIPTSESRTQILR